MERPNHRFYDYVRAKDIVIVIASPVDSSDFVARITMPFRLNGFSVPNSSKTLRKINEPI